MPEDRPLPLTGEEELEPDPLLGVPVDNFPSRRLRVLAIGWSFLIGLSLLINVAIWNVYDAAWVGPIVVGLMGSVALAVGWWVMHQWNREVILYEHGFSYREGSENIPFLYAEVQGVRLRAEQIAYFGGLLRRQLYRITVTLRTGEKIRLDNTYRRIDALGDKLLAAVCSVLEPLVMHQLQSGEPVPFADYLTVSEHGLTVAAEVLEGVSGDVHLPWADFGGYKVQQRQLNLLTSQGAVWFGVPLAEIDNLPLLLDVLQTRLGTQEGIEKR